MKIKFDKQKILLYMGFIAYLKPYNFSLNSKLDFACKLIKIIVTLIMIIAFFSRNRKNKFELSVQAVLAILFYLIYSVSVYINCDSFNNIFQEILSFLGIIIFGELIRKNYNLQIKVLNVLKNISIIYIWMHFFTVLMQRPLFGIPKNDYDIYFLGSDNYSAFILIPLAGFITIHDFKKYSKIKIFSYVTVFVGLFNLLYVFSVAGMFAYIIFMICILFFNYELIKKVFNIKNALLINLGIVVGVIFFDITTVLQPILGLVGKTGFVGREIIWKNAFYMFEKNFLIGVGSLTETQIREYILYGASHAHNLFLEILMDTGVIGTTIFFAWTRKILSYKDNDNKPLKCAYYCITAMIFCSIFDFYIGNIYYVLLLVITYMLIPKEKYEGSN